MAHSRFVSRAADQSGVGRDPATGYQRKQVFGRPDHPVEIIQVDMPAGKSVVLPASSYARIRQAVWVHTGQLVITGKPLHVAEQHGHHVLAAGDCLGLRVDQPFGNDLRQSNTKVRAAVAQLFDLSC